jgi:hypothetical protein
MSQYNSVQYPNYQSQNFQMYNHPQAYNPQNNFQNNYQNYYQSFSQNQNQVQTPPVQNPSLVVRNRSAFKKGQTAQQNPETEIKIKTSMDNNTIKNIIQKSNNVINNKKITTDHNPIVDHTNTSTMLHKNEKPIEFKFNVDYRNHQLPAENNGNGFSDVDNKKIQKYKEMVSRIKNVLSE